MNQELLSPIMRVYDERVDMVSRRCFQIMYLEYWGDLTRVDGPKMDAGVIFEAYVSDGFIITGLLPMLTAKVAAKMGMISTSHADKKPWSEQLSYMITHTRRNKSKKYAELTCMERFQKAHTYTALRVSRRCRIDLALLAEFGYRKDMTLNDVRLGTLRLFMEKCIEWDKSDPATDTAGSASQSGLEIGVRASHNDAIRRPTSPT